jgi:UDP-glucose 4-epimerase
MYGMVLPRFVESAMKNAPLQVYGDGTQTRCFCHVSDVVDALIKLFDTPASVGHVFNLGSDEEISINDLAKKVIEFTGSKSTIRHIPYEQAYGQKFDDLPRRVPKLDRIRATIGFSPKLNLSQIIRELAQEQRKSAC